MIFENIKFQFHSNVENNKANKYSSLVLSDVKVLFLLFLKENIRVDGVMCISFLYHVLPACLRRGIYCPDLGGFFGVCICFHIV